MLKKCISSAIACVALTAMSSCGMTSERPSQSSHAEGAATQELRGATAQILGLQPASATAMGAAPAFTNGDTGLTLKPRDAGHRRFIESRLRYVGKTPETAPNLFTRLSRAAASAPIAADDVMDQDCSNPLSVTQDPTNPNRYEARIITSCFNGADYSYVDLFWWNTATGQTLAYDFNEDFNNPRDLTLAIIANGADIGTTIQVDSMAINSRGIEDHYAYANLIQERPSVIATTDNVFHPSDQALPLDGVVTTCLDRGGNDCDYTFPHTSDIQFPISMSFRFPGAVSAIMSTIAQVHMVNTGGVCPTQDLSQFVTHSGAVVTLNTMGPANFGPKCVENQQAVRFWVRVIATNTRGVTYSMYWANDRPNDPKNFPMQFRWSCLAEGSNIVMANGLKKAIEDIEIGDSVQSGPGQALSVVDVTRGFESAPIVELESANGGTLLVTQGHPLFDGDGKAVRADELAVGSMIKTSTGTTKITKLTRKPFAGKVYNLKLGTDHQIEGLDVSTIHMYANGLSVGDSRSQWALELAREQRVASTPMHDEWRQDSLMHAAVKAGVRQGGR